MPTRICPSCGVQASDERKFCAECGTKLDAQPAEAAAAPDTAADAPTTQAQAAQPWAQQGQQPPGNPQAQAQAQPQMQTQTQSQQASTLQTQTQAPTLSMQGGDPHSTTPAPEEKPMKVIGYLLTLFVFTLPLIGIVMAFLWALGKKTKRNLKRLATAQLILWGIGLALTISLYIAKFQMINALIRLILDFSY